MPWLIEAFLDEDYFEEEMRTAADFRKKKEMEEYNRGVDIGKTLGRSGKIIVAKGRGEEAKDALNKVQNGKYNFRKEIDNEKKSGDLYKSVDKAIGHKYGRNWKSEISKNAEKAIKNPNSVDETKANKMLNLGTDIERAQDAAERHNRRHPESKLESSFLSEIFQ